MCVLCTWAHLAGRRNRVHTWRKPRPSCRAMHFAMECHESVLVWHCSGTMSQSVSGNTAIPQPGETLCSVSGRPFQGWARMSWDGKDKIQPARSVKADGKGQTVGQLLETISKLFAGGAAVSESDSFCWQSKTPRSYPLEYIFISFKWIHTSRLRPPPPQPTKMPSSPVKETDSRISYTRWEPVNGNDEEDGGLVVVNTTSDANQNRVSARMVSLETLLERRSNISIRHQRKEMTLIVKQWGAPFRIIGASISLVASMLHWIIIIVDLALLHLFPWCLARCNVGTKTNPTSFDSWYRVGPEELHGHWCIYVQEYELMLKTQILWPKEG